MGFREALLLGTVLLFLDGDRCAAIQNRSSPSAAKTLTQILQEGATVSLQLPRSFRSNRTEQGDLGPYHVSHRLRVYQLRKPDKQKPQHARMQASQNPQRLEASHLTLEQLGRGGTFQILELSEPLIHGPDLNPPLNPESKVRVKSEWRVPVPASSVAVRCGEGMAAVEVKQNFLGNGQLISPGDLTLGGCAALHVDDHILQFQTDLQGCNSTMKMTEEALVYSFSLRYSPKAIGNTAVLKTNPAQMVVECHYRRKQYVSSGALRPSWEPFASRTSAEQQLRFSLRLVTEDWQSARSSNVYFLSDVIRVEAAVLQGHHIPLRVFVDSCVATLTPNPDSKPRYPFINNHGCFSDAKLTGAKSYFMPRSQEDKLHFQLKAFRFYQDDRNSLYITCHLKATALSVPVDSQHKACSFLTDRWVASGGDNKVCSCCETSCDQQRRQRRLAAGAAGTVYANTGGFPLHLQWEGMAALGPILLEENILEVELPAKPALLIQTTSTDSSTSMAALCGVGVALALALLVLIGAAIRSQKQKSTGHDVCT